MKLKYFFYVLYLLIQYNISMCSEGCIKCSTEDVCEICDAKLNYILTPENNCIE